MVEKISNADLVAFGYAPGSYTSTCSSCRKIMTDVDKYARRCRSCAISAFEEAVKDEQKLSGDGITRIEISADSLGHYLKYNSKQYGPYANIQDLKRDLATRLTRQFG